MKRKIKNLIRKLKTINYKYYLIILGIIIIIALSIWKLGILKALAFLSVVVGALLLYYFGGKFIMNRNKRRRKPTTKNTVCHKVIQIDAWVNASRVRVI